MKKIILCFIFLACILISKAQNTTTGDTEPLAVLNKTAVLVIPFESKMYMSDIDKDLALKNEMNFQDIKAKFRAALDQNIYIALKQYYTPLSFYSINPEESRAELMYIYNSVGYQYEVVPEEVLVEKESAGKKLIGKFKKSKRSGDPLSNKGTKDDYVKAGVQNGEIVSQVDNREKYMKTKVTNEKLFPNLNKKYQAAHYIFINQLDIKRSADKRYVASEEEYQREIKVHYTIFDMNAKEVSSGAIKSRFSSDQNDMDKIIKVQFPLIAERIVSNLIGPDKASVE